MGLDIKKFLNEEGLSLKKFGDWLVQNHNEEPSKVQRYKIPLSEINSPGLLKKLIESIKGKKDGIRIYKEWEDNCLLVEVSGEYFVTLIYSDGQVKVPKPLIS